MLDATAALAESASWFRVVTASIGHHHCVRGEKKVFFSPALRGKSRGNPKFSHSLHNLFSLNSLCLYTIYILYNLYSLYNLFTLYTFIFGGALGKVC